MHSALQPGATIGILGGGQLGRMLAVAASRLGFKAHIFTPEQDSPAANVASYSTIAAYSDISALKKFAASVDIITYEFENIPLETFRAFAESIQVFPGVHALEVSQDRASEKAFLQTLGLRTARHAIIERQEDVLTAAQQIGLPAFLKTCRFGYDGKGQIYVTEQKGLDSAWETLHHSTCVLEEHVPFSCEISVIGARSQQGQIVCFEPGENIHENGILRTTTVPARINENIRLEVIRSTHQILDALKYVGVMGVEFFITPQGAVINEIAPRVHNSGHWTQNGCAVDQFEQHVRAITGLPLGDGIRHCDVVMTNLIGQDVLDRDAHCAESHTSIHMYGKAQIQAGRKMGHINKIFPWEGSSAR